jgi:hypothetical protein
MGTPVGTWKLGSSTVTFDADGTVTRLDEGNAPDPDFLAPLQSGKPGRWTIKGRALTLIATNPGGAETKVNYEYSVGTDDKGKPALSIDITSGPHKNSTYTLVRE